MNLYMVIETDAGLTVVDHDPATDPTETAVRYSGALTDGQLYKTYDDAYDALLVLKQDEEDEAAQRGALD